MMKKIKGYTKECKEGREWEIDVRKGGKEVRKLGKIGKGCQGGREGRGLSRRKDGETVVRKAGKEKGWSERGEGWEGKRKSCHEGCEEERLSEREGRGKSLSGTEGRGKVLSGRE